MKENLIKDKEIAFLSRKLVTIDTQAPIEIGLEDILYQGSDIKQLGRFYDEMGFKQFKQALEAEIEPEETTDITFEEVTEVCPEMLSKDDFFYFEMLGDNYHIDEMVGFAWGNSQQIYASQDISLLQQPVFKEFLENTALKVYDFKRSKVLLVA